MEAEKIKETERILKALANKRRIIIVQWLHKDPPMSVGDLSKKLKLSFKSTSKHLAVLRAASIIEAEQSGLVMNYRLAQPLHPITRLVLR